jgi:phospholipid N-methyltransferase
MSDVPSSANASSTDFITKLEAKMDEKNSFSQQSMIELQSLTNKRDQSYDMISNVLKSLNTTLVGNANNL